MKKLSKIFKSHAFLWFAAALIASLVIWFIGPLIGIILIFLAWLIAHLKGRLKEYHFFHARPQASLNGEGRIDRREKKRIAIDFKKLKKFLLSQGRGALYDLPWYLVMGDQGSGKTSLLRDAELNISYQSYNHINHRTSSFQWVLAEEGLFIDLPHLFCLQKDAQQKFNWLSFLKYLKKVRVRRPLNGIILTVNLKELAEKKLGDWQESIRVRIHELQQKLGMQIPVYIVMTHTDLILGFPEFVMRFNDQERSEVMGITFNVDDKVPQDHFPFAYDELIASLNLRLKRDLDQEWLDDKSSDMYYFPMQMAALRESLASFAKILFTERRYFTPMLWRGLYFVSQGLHSPSRYDVILDELNFDTSELPKAFKSRRFFIEGVFRDSILKESEIVGVQPFYAQHYSLMHRLKLMGILGGTGLMAILWATSMVKHESYNDLVLASLQNPSLDTLGNLYHQGVDGSGSSLLHLGLLSYPSSVDGVETLYHQALITGYLPQVFARLHVGLQAAVAANASNGGNMSNVENLYAWLSSYLMFNEQKHMDIKEVQNLLDSSGPDLYLSDLLQFGFPPQALDGNLVQNARQALWNSPIYMQAYLLLKLNALANNQESFSLAGQMDADSSEVFGNLEEASVPEFFSKTGYKDIYEKQAGNSLSQVTSQSWVLGPNDHETYSAADLAKDQSEMDNLYWTDYINAWDNALSQINIASFQSLQQEIDVLATLTQKDSPITNVLTVIQKNSDYGTNLSADITQGGVTNNIVTNHYLPLISLLSNAGAGGAPIQNVVANLAALQQYLQGIANSSNPGLSAYNAASQIFAGQADKSLITLAASASQAPMPLSRWLNQIVNNSYAIIFASANQYLSTQWQAEVYSFYQQALSDRFPFTDSSSEVTIQDFSNFFKPGGVEDSFDKKYLAPFLTEDSFGHTEWNSVNDIPFSNNGAVTTEITEAASIRNTFFGGNNAALNFTISPVLSSNDKVILNYDGKSLTIDDDSNPGVAMMWPPQNTDGTVSLTFHRVVETDQTENFFGPWGLFHLLQASSLVRSKYGSQYQVTHSYDGMSVVFSLSANSIDNPFDLKLLRNYTCPGSF